MRRARTLRVLLALASAAAVTSCVRVPREGPVVEAHPPGLDDQTPQSFSYDPPPPQPGASPDDIVSGFLEAMRATPVRIGPAKAYLTSRAQLQWRPRQVLVYGGRTTPVGHRNVVVNLHGADLIGPDGRWRGATTPDASRIRFPMVQENGQWRIAAAPDALIVERDFYQQNYTSQDTSQNTSLYFFDPTGRILVPEVVHVPEGSQLASALVKGLLRGPGRSRSGVEQSFFPRALTVNLSVAVDKSVAEVSLDGPDPGPLSPKTAQLMLAQLAWTLRQDPSISSFTLTVVGRVVTDSSGARRFGVRAPEFDRYDPAAEKATLVTYALRRGRLVSGQVDRLTKVIGPFGTQDLGIGAFAVSLDSDSQVAAIGGRALRVGPVLGPSQPVVVQSGPGLLRPAWDFANRLWEVQNGPDGASVGYITSGVRHDVHIRGVSGESVRQFLVSRDGSRFIAVLRDAGGDRLVVSRLRYDAEGRALGASRAQEIPWRSPGTKQILDIGWTTPTTLLVLDRVSDVRSEVRILNVDRSTRPGEVSPTTIPGRARYLVTSPASQTSQTPYAVTESGLTDISPAEPNRPIPIPRHLRHVTYAG